MSIIRTQRGAELLPCCGAVRSSDCCFLNLSPLRITGSLHQAYQAVIGAGRCGDARNKADAAERSPLIDVSCFTDSDRESGHLGINAMGQSTKALSFSPLRGSKSREAGSPVEGMVKGARYHEMD
jgi:hypothetical protein